MLAVSKRVTGTGGEQPLCRGARSLWSRLIVRDVVIVEKIVRPKRCAEAERREASTSAAARTRSSAGTPASCSPRSARLRTLRRALAT